MGGGNFNEEIDEEEPKVFQTVRLEEFATEGDWREFEETRISLGPSGHLELEDDEDRSPRCGDYSTVVAVDGCKCKSYDYARSLLREKGSGKTLRLMSFQFSCLFLNPAFMIDIGLLVILKFQIEELGLDVNSQEYAGAFFRGADDDYDFQEGLPLLLHALVQPDRELFDYILSREDIKANPIMIRGVFGDDISRLSTTLLHSLAVFVRNDYFREGLDLLRIQKITEREEVYIDTDNGHGTPVEVLCTNFAKEPQKADHDIAQFLLRTGAKVSPYTMKTVRNELIFVLDDAADNILRDEFGTMVQLLERYGVQS